MCDAWDSERLRCSLPTHVATPSKAVRAFTQLGCDPPWLPGVTPLLEAITTVSACPRHNNERLEFLGDSFIKVHPYSPRVTGVG